MPAVSKLYGCHRESGPTWKTTMTHRNIHQYQQGSRDILTSLRYPSMQTNPGPFHTLFSTTFSKFTHRYLQRFTFSQLPLRLLSNSYFYAAHMLTHPTSSHYCDYKTNSNHFGLLRINCAEVRYFSVPTLEVFHSYVPHCVTA
jgi:hypothetical protein